MVPDWLKGNGDGGSVRGGPNVRRLLSEVVVRRGEDRQRGRGAVAGVVAAWGGGGDLVGDFVGCEPFEVGARFVGVVLLDAPLK